MDGQTGESPRSEPTDSELNNLYADTYLFDDYHEIEEQIDLLVGLVESGNREAARQLLIKDLRVVFWTGVLAHAENPNLLDEHNRAGN